MNDNRQTVRMRRLKEGRVIFNKRQSVMSCIVRDASKFGARLTIGEPYLVPHEFEFLIAGEDPKPARKIWIRDNEMGVEFLT